MPEMQILMSGIVFGEQPRWHDGRLWFSDWGTQEVIAVDLEANNELVVDGRGNAYLNGGGYDLTAGEPFAPGIVALVTPDGSARQVADDLAFPNGMLMTADRGCFACALASPDKKLFMIATAWSGPAGMFAGPRTGQVLAVDAPAQGAGWP
jgi:sugar lactone lactonase YvrE